MRLVLIAALLIAVNCYAAPCKVRVTRSQAIILAKPQLLEGLSKSADTYFRWTAKLDGCTWMVVGHTPPDDISGDLRAAVDAQTGKVGVYPRPRTDPNKLRKMQIIKSQQSKS